MENCYIPGYRATEKAQLLYRSQRHIDGLKEYPRFAALIVLFGAVQARMAGLGSKAPAATGAWGRVSIIIVI